MGDCSECKWRMNFDQETRCLLGRGPGGCTNAPARRGDDELVGRLLDLPGEEQDELQQRLKRMNEALRKIEGSDRK